ncbi:MAG: hypothetical protein JST75_22150 [Bacteroidetes bacterium]|nr:hypothetical protein [Bacteroidota bacterium]
MIISTDKKNGIEILTIKNDQLSLSIAPELGGKIISIFNIPLQKEFLWINKNLSLKINQPGDDYDSNFLGGIDELIPNDIPETIDHISYPDHGELWTCVLNHKISNEKIHVYGHLPLSGLDYEKTIWTDESSPVIHISYKIKNTTQSQRNFLWKLHAALNVEAGDKIITNAKHGKVVDPQYSRFTDTNEFDWPMIEGINASIIPPNNNSMDFFYLYDISIAEMQLLSKDDKTLFSYSYDKKIFPYEWYFASYGGFLNHYTVILEPCSAMPISVSEAKQKKQCTILNAGEELTTSVKIFAGEKKNYIPSHE